MSRIFIVDQERRPLMPCTPARARILLKRGQAAILRRAPFVLILKESRPNALVRPMRVKLDPGSKTSGIAVVNDTTGEVLWAAELTHRSADIRQRLTSRRAVRRSRRDRKTRYRQARWQNRRRAVGWLAPSLVSRIFHLLTWVARLSHWCPVGALSQELVRFDTAALQDPSLEGSAYQRGTLFACELREYVLTRFDHRCVYCQRTEYSAPTGSRHPSLSRWLGSPIESGECVRSMQSEEGQPGVGHLFARSTCTTGADPDTVKSISGRCCRHQ